MSEPLPDVTVPNGASRFNVPTGAGFVQWFAALRASINVLSVEILNRAVEAIGGELDQRGVLGGSQIPEGADLSFAITDEDGRQLWIQATKAGGLTPYTTQKIIDALTPTLGPSLSMTTTNSEVTGRAFTVTDEDGLVTELEIGMDGRFTQRVIDSIGSRLSITPGSGGGATDPAVILTPASIPMLVGRTYKLYAEDFIDALDPSHTVLFQSGGNGGNVGTHWLYTPTTAKSFTLAIVVVDVRGVEVKRRDVPITVYAAPTATGKRHLAIGDSITRGGTYVGDAIASLPGATTVGTRTYNNAALNVEGRGGWSLATYFSRIGSATGGDSPFLFPVGVAGAKFWGNTEFWRKVCYVPMADLPSAGYDFDGFQYIARGWKPTGNPYLYDTTGYPTAPAEGDVVIDPTRAAGSQWQQYTGGAWAAMSPQPTVEFSFPKYMDRYAAAYPAGGPTSVSMMLQTNDFFTVLSDAAWTTWKANLDTLIASVRAWSATVPFIVVLAPAGGPWDKWATETVQKYEFDRRIRDSGARILAAYDTPAQRTNRVHVATFLGSVSPQNMADYVHPGPAGHAEMGSYLVGKLAQLTTEGL